MCGVVTGNKIGEKMQGGWVQTMYMAISDSVKTSLLISMRRATTGGF